MLIDSFHSISSNFNSICPINWRNLLDRSNEIRPSLVYSFAEMIWHWYGTALLTSSSIYLLIYQWTSVDLFVFPMNSNCWSKRNACVRICFRCHLSFDSSQRLISERKSLCLVFFDICHCFVALVNRLMIDVKCSRMIDDPFFSDEKSFRLISSRNHDQRAKFFAKQYTGLKQCSLWLSNR